MNRIIKFRQPVFRNGNFDRWHYWGYLREGEFIGPISGSDDKLGNVWSKSYQFVGLYDSTRTEEYPEGREIYEGDILEWDEIEWGGAHKEVVEWDYELFNMRKSDWSQWCVKIGDRFSTPELLKEEK